MIAERPAAGEPEGLLVLHHGRGTTERDLIGLADVLDPEQRLHIAAPRGPLELPGSPGYHWYIVPRVGYPDPDSFFAAQALLAQTHDELFERTGVGPERTVLGGFSMGSVMSYALAFDAERPVVAGALIFSGFVPTVPGWAPDWRTATDVFLAHGRTDPIMDVAFGRAAHEQLEAAGVPCEYHETDAAHFIDPPVLDAAVTWLARTLG